MTSNGYAAIGDATKKNQKRLSERQMEYGAYGGLAGMLLMLPVPIPGSSLAGGVLGTTLGRQIGKWRHKDIDIKDMEAKQVHPLLMPPRVVKQRTTLSVKE